MNRRVRPIRIGTLSPPVFLDVAIGLGETAEAGLEVETVSGPSSADQFAALLRGELDAVITSADNVVTYRCVPGNPLGMTADVRIAAAIDRGLGLSLFAAPGIRAAEDLNGGVLGVDVPVSGFAFTAYELLARLGLSAGSDLTVEQLGPTPLRARALAAGTCTATVLNAGSDLRAEEQGCRRLARATALGPYLGAVLASTGRTIDADDGRLRSLVRILTHTSARLTSGELREETVRAAVERLGLSVPAARRYADTLADPDEGLIPQGRVPAAALETLLTLRRRHAPATSCVPDSGLIDDRFL
ncbi:ABC transporter substrate-binding protein [Actinomadura sp. 1N219]|uniref:ABC transporter substrate-binding protein n=1 Tax=Actinomadura sp. 1N219 TaxID=3375152 RepID=UPI0037ADD2FF